MESNYSDDSDDLASNSGPETVMILIIETLPLM